MGNENVFAAVVDLETTGLRASMDVPLEVGIKLIDKEGYVFAAGAWLIWEDNFTFESGIARGRKNEFVNAMHEKSGLWSDLEAARTGMSRSFTRDEVDNALCDFLREAIGEDAFGTIPMMGNSIGSLDRPFSLVHFPMFNSALSYRNIDVSTINEICKAVNPGLLENLRPIIGDKSNSKHRVLDDIDACIVEYRAYLDNFFFTED
jgi:oligoribonuclease (3'-5' exoribonuclease)